MKLYSSPLSPFARKVRILILEKQLSDRIDIIVSNPYDATPDHLSANPLSKVPTLVLDTGESVYDSYVICEYLDVLNGNPLMPAGEKRVPALQQMALTDGLMQTTFNIAVELNRREEHERSMAWVQRWTEALERGVDALAESLTGYSEALALPHIGAVCALDYLDLRASDRLDWRKQQPSLQSWYETYGERPAMVETRPIA